jgi:hypothetical protein
MDAIGTRIGVETEAFRGAQLQKAEAIILCDV